MVFLHNKEQRTQCREWESHETHQYVCNYVDPNSDAFVSELCITSSEKDILPDVVAHSTGQEVVEIVKQRHTNRESVGKWCPCCFHQPIGFPTI